MIFVHEKCRLDSDLATTLNYSLHQRGLQLIEGSPKWSFELGPGLSLLDSSVDVQVDCTGLDLTSLVRRRCIVALSCLCVCLSRQAVSYRDRGGKRGKVHEIIIWMISYDSKSHHEKSPAFPTGGNRKMMVRMC